MGTIIKVNDVTLVYRKYTENITSLKEFLISKIKRKLTYTKFHALSSVSFSINQGEVVGIIGRNGAGKSTILKVISRIVKPTLGSIETSGNIVPMLELGSGFDFDLTGIENIYLNGAILGYSESFLSQHINQIVEFSELGDFIYSPIRNYSSGMLIRLAFSISTIINPDILIVDEILAVGDENFQHKSRNKMVELMKSGTTVLFVSHNIDQVREICDTVIWLENGKVKMMGNVEEVTNKYIESFNY